MAGHWCIYVRQSKTKTLRGEAADDVVIVTATVTATVTNIP
jgi:hypothetical protein